MSEYIIDAQQYLPDFLTDSTLMVSIVDCLNALISNETIVFENIENAYNDMLYKTRDYSRLSYEAKINIVRELGFDYLLDILTLTSDQLTQLLIFFNLIYLLKGKREGLDICLQTLGMVYTYTTWDEMSPKGQPFTASLTIIGSEFAQIEVFRKLRNFIRSYMLPWIEITVEITIESPPLYVYPSVGILTRYKDSTIYTATRDVYGLAIYDQSNYDTDYYGAEINSGPDQYDRYELPKAVLTIQATPANATIMIDNEQTYLKELEIGIPSSYSVSLEGYKTKTGQIVIQRDKVLNVTLQPE